MDTRRRTSKGGRHVREGPSRVRNTRNPRDTSTRATSGRKSNTRTRGAPLNDSTRAGKKELPRQSQETTTQPLTPRFPRRSKRSTVISQGTEVDQQQPVDAVDVPESFESGRREQYPLGSAQIDSTDDDNDEVHFSFPERCPTTEELQPSTHDNRQTITSSPSSSAKRPSGAAPPVPSKKRKLSASGGNAFYLETISDLRRRNRLQQDEILTFKEENAHLKSQLTSLRDEHKKMLKTNNDLKAAISELEAAQKTSSSAIGRNVDSASLADTLQSTKKQVVQLQYQLSVLANSQSPSKGTKAGSQKALSVLPELFRAQCTVLFDHCTAWALRESQELNPNILDRNVRNWENRKSIEKNLPDSFPVMARSPHELSALGTLYTPSFLNVKECVRFYVSYMFSNNDLLKSMTNEKDEKLSMEYFFNFSSLIQRMKKALSDGQTSRKRIARDHLLLSLGWGPLCSRKYSASVKANSQDANVQAHIREIKQKLRIVDDTGALNYGHWRTADLKHLCAESHKEDLPTDSKGNGDFLFRDDMRVSVFKEFLGYDPISGDPADSTPVEGTVLSLARLDAWFATVIEMQGNDTTRGGRKQRQFQSCFANHLVGAFRCLIQTVALKIIEMKAFDVALVTLKDASNGKKYRAVKPVWFDENISKHLGHVLDCFVAEYYKGEDGEYYLRYSMIAEDGQAIMGEEELDNSSQGSGLEEDNRFPESSSILENEQVRTATAAHVSSSESLDSN